MKFKKEGGLQTKGYIKDSTHEEPLITIVTVVFNGERYIEETILSVINQKYKNIEYIIIDGGSNDNTINIIKKYEDLIDYWMSMDDDGIYDAMNKALKIAKGKWINFMNCGDCFCNNEVIEKIEFCNYSKYVMIYGNTRVHNSDRAFIKNLKSFNMNKINLAIFSTRVVCHQAVFYNRKVNFKFPKQYKLKGELYSYLEYLNYGKALRINLDICNFFLGGRGNLQKEKNIKETWSVLKDQLGIMRFLYIPMGLYNKIKLSF